MPEIKRPLHVFLCHTSADKSSVRELYLRLKAEEWIDPWLDVAKILPGQHWTSVIRKSLVAADSVIILISNNSINREGFVQREMNYAWDLSLEKPRNVIYLIPLRLEECDVPFDLQERQWADYFGEKKEETYNALLESLKLRYEQKLKIEEEEYVRQKIEQERRAVEEKTRKEAEEKTRLEAEERAGKEKDELERKAAEVATLEKEKREAAEKAKHEKAVREKEKRDAAEKAKRERKELPVVQIALVKRSLSNLIISLKSGLVPTRPLFWGIGVILVIFIGWFAIKPIFSSLPIATPNTTNTPISLTKTHTPTATRTHLPTRMPSFTPTIIFTATPVPTSNILLQEDFEDNAAQGWWAWNENMTKKRQPKWTIDLEPGGNHYASFSGDPKGTTIWYGDRTLTWIDYVFESRINFVNSAILDIYAHADGGDAQYAITMDNLGNIVFAQFHAPIYAELHRGPSIVFAQNRWYMLRLEISGNLLSIYVDNSLVKAQELPVPLINPQGGIGYTVTGGKFFIDDIKVWSLK